MNQHCCASSNLLIYHVTLFELKQVDIHISVHRSEYMTHATSLSRTTLTTKSRMMEQQFEPGY